MWGASVSAVLVVVLVLVVVGVLARPWWGLRGSIPWRALCCPLGATLRLRSGIGRGENE